MLNGILATIYTNGTTAFTFAMAAAAALALGVLTAWSYRRSGGSSSNMGWTLALLPLLVQTVILLVNGNLGAGVAVAGAFPLNAGHGMGHYGDFSCDDTGACLRHGLYSGSSSDWGFGLCALSPARRMCRTCRTGGA